MTAALPMNVGKSTRLVAADRQSFLTINTGLVVALTTALLLGGMTIGIVMKTNGQVLFTLDDPYIHLAMAERLSTSLHYGINADEPSSPSSSILYPFLLVPFVRLGIGQLGATLLCAAGTIATSLLTFLILAENGIAPTRSRPENAAALTIVFTLCFNTLGLASTGLEHSLHGAAVLGCLLGVLRFQRRERTGAMMPLCALLAVSLRYEGVSLWLAVTLLLAWKRRFLGASVLLCCGLLILAGFSVFLDRLGLGFLPNSIAAKTTLMTPVPYSIRVNEALSVCLTEGSCFCLAGLFLVLARNLRFGSLLLAFGLLGLSIVPLIHLYGLPIAPHPRLGGSSDCVGFVQLIPWQVMNNALTEYGSAQIVLFATLITFGGAKAWRTGDANTVQLAVIGVALAAAHLLAGKFGWFSRYEIYALLSCAAIACSVHAACCTKWVRQAGTRQWLGLAFVSVALMWPYVRRLADVPDAAQNISDQQFQMHRFATQFHRGAIAVNDLGQVSFHNAAYVLDLWGLGSSQALAARAQGADPAWMDQLASAHEVRVAMIYAQDFPRLPSAWVPVGKLALHRPRVAVKYLDVAIFSTRAKYAGDLRRELTAFSKSLPAADTIEFDDAGEQTPAATERAH